MWHCILHQQGDAAFHYSPLLAVCTEVMKMDENDLVHKGLTASEIIPKTTTIFVPVNSDVPQFHHCNFQLDNIYSIIPVCM